MRDKTEGQGNWRKWTLVTALVDGDVGVQNGHSRLTLLAQGWVLQTGLLGGAIVKVGCLKQEEVFACQLSSQS